MHTCLKKKKNEEMQQQQKTQKIGNQSKSKNSYTKNKNIVEIISKDQINV